MCPDKEGPPMYFDTHAHYDDKAFDNDRHALLARLNDEGVDLSLIHI